MGTSRTGGLQRLKPGGNKEAKTDGKKGSKPGYRKNAPKVYDGKKKPTFLDLQKTKKKEKKEKRNVKEVDRKGRKGSHYVSFKNKIATDYSIVYRLSTKQSVINQLQDKEDDLHSSVFHATLEYWYNLNRSTQFNAAVKALNKHITLPQVLYHKAEIYEALKTSLETCTALSAQPFLELTAGFATDMQHEFYPHLEEVLNIFLTNILVIEDPDTIKNTFRCIGHLMKILWRPISQHLEDVYTVLCPLFSLKNREFIRYLGADAISFLYRKAKDKKEFAEIILSKVEDATDPIAVAKLFFESFKAVDGKFNFQLESTLDILLEILPGHHNSILIQLIKFVCEHTTHEFIKPIQDKLFDKVKQNCANHLIFLDCLNILISANNGLLVKDSATLADFLKSCTPTDKQPSANLFKCYSSLLLESIDKSSEVYEKCIELVTKSNFEADLVCELINKVVENPIFDEYYFKPYLAWVQTHIDTNYDLISRQLSHICTVKSEATPKLASDLEHLKIFTLDFNLVPALRKVKNSDLFTNKMIEKINVSSSKDTLKESIIICRSFKQVDKAKLTSLLDEVFHKIVDENLGDKLEVLPVIITALFALHSSSKVASMINLEKCTNLFVKYPANVYVLQMFDFMLLLHLLQDSADLGGTDKEKVFTALVDHLGSWEPVAREIAVHALTLVIPLLGDENLGENREAVIDVVNKLLYIQSIPEDFHEHREKLNNMTNLSAGRLPESFQRHEKLMAIVLKFFLGSLYTNFTMLWKPLEDIIVGYAHFVNPEIFWNIYSAQMRKAYQDIDDLITSVNEKGEAIVSLDGRKVDFLKYRNRLWFLMGQFTAVAEPHHRELVAFFLDDFKHKEYPALWKLKNSSEYYKNEIGQGSFKSVVAHLTTFSSFKNIKGFARQNELREEMLNLLTSRFTKVQTAAINILASMDIKFILPYKEQLNFILEDDNFQKGLQEFPLAEDTTKIKPEHRDDLLPIIFRILIGRMKSVKGGGDKKFGAERRKIQVLRYIMDCSAEHIKIFLGFQNDNVYNDCNFGDGSVIDFILAGKPAPKMELAKINAIVLMTKATLTTLEQFIASNCDYMLELIIWLGYHVDAAYATTDDNALKIKKNVKRESYKLIKLFFDMFPNYDYSDKVVDAIFQCYVWRPLNMFWAYDRSPSGLLNLVLTWAKNRQFHRFFFKADPTTGTTLLPNIVQMLNNPKAHEKVIQPILQVIKNLVAPKDVQDQKGHAPGAMEVDGDGDTSLGLKAVMPEVEPIIQYFDAWIKKITGQKNKNEKGLRTNLDILINISPVITDPATVLTFMQQLLSLAGQLDQQYLIIATLAIVEKMADKIESSNVDKIVAGVLPFYSKLIKREGLDRLSKLLQVLKPMTTEYARTCELCINLTAYQHRRFEEADFETRINQCIQIRDLVRNQEKFTDTELTAMVYICSKAIGYETDQALKSNYLDTLLALCKTIKQIGETDAVRAMDLLDNLLLPKIRLGFKHGHDIVRIDYFHIFHRLVVECQDIEGHRLNEFTQLLRPDDPEADFFENIRHVQLPRRSRAIHRLNEKLKENPTMISQKNMVQLLLPMISCYMLNPEIQSKNAPLVFYAQEFMELACKILNWREYDKQLKYYLGKFKDETVNQKQLVRIVKAILEGFHFPLNTDDMEELSEEEKAKRIKISFTVNSSLLPQLVNMLAGKNKKKVEKGTSGVETDEQLIQRVPLAIPVVKIFKLNSQAVLEQGVPSIIAKIGSFLKSRGDDIRETARRTLNDIMQELGPRFISYLVRDLNAVLTRGYQVHVLSYTINKVLSSMKTNGQLKSGDLDSSIDILTTIALADMFEIASEEKEVKEMTRKIFETKFSMSNSTMQIVAQFISSRQLVNLVRPFADKLKEFSTHKNIHKIKEILRHIAMGVLDNPSLDPMMTVLFIYALLTDNLNLVSENTDMNKLKQKPKQIESTTFILVPEPRRGGNLAKNTAASSKHVLQEFGLNLLYFLFKRGQLIADNAEHCTRINPFFAVLLDYTSSSHPSIIAVSLRCMSFMVKMPLECITESNILELSSKVFILLKKYGGGTDCQGDNLEVVVVANKLLAALIRNGNLSKLKDAELKSVFEYVLFDVMDPTKAATAFGLLQAILSRKIVHEDLHNLMMKLAELAITSNLEHIRNSCRAVVLNYLKNYDLKEKMNQVMDFLVAQLDYEVEVGRLAATDILTLAFREVGAALEESAEYLFISMSPYLSNTDSDTTRAAINKTLAALLKAVKKEKAIMLLDNTLTWFSADSLPQNLLACKLLAVFIDALEVEFIRTKLKMIVPKLMEFLKSSDNVVIQVLTLVQKIVRNDPSNFIFKNSVYLDNLKTCLLHGHALVRLITAQLFGSYLAQTVKFPALESWLNSPGILRSLILDTFEQLALVTEVTSEMGVQVIKNLVALTKLVKPGDAQSEEELSFEYVVKKSIRYANHELTHQAYDYTKRTLVFNYIAAVVMQTDKEHIQGILGIILTPLYREASRHTRKEIKPHAQEVMDLIKSKFPEDEVFNKALMEVQLAALRNRDERKEKLKHQLIEYPERAAKRKIAKNENRNLKRRKNF